MTLEAVHAGRYRYGDLLGETNVARTHLASDATTGARCVVKSVKLADVKDEKILELFRREARVLANLDHPRIPKFLGVFEEGAGPERTINLVQQFIPGRNLARAIEDGMRFVEKDVVRLAIELCRILEYLHAFSPPIIHRDVKPSNIVIDDARQPYLIDFGGVRDKMMHDRSPHGGGMTVVGSYGYMPYEQFEGRAVPASDIYALGVTLVFLLSHKEPSDLDRDGLRLRIADEIHVSPAFRRVLERMIEPDWRDRYQTAAELRAALEAVQQGTAPRLSPGVRLGAAFLAVALVAGGWFVIGRNRPAEPSGGAAVVSRMSAPPAAASSSDVSLVGTPVVRGRLLFDGKPLPETTTAAPKFWFRSEDRMRAQGGAARHRNGAFDLHGFSPGRYGMSVRVDAEESNPPLYPGDFESWTTFTVGEDEVRAVDVNLYRILRLRSPVDNWTKVPGSSECGDRPVHPRALTIAWDPVGEGVTYEYAIRRVTCPYRNQIEVVRGSLAESSVRVVLDPTAPNEFYVLDLSAMKDGRMIGRLVTHGSNYLAWDHRFQVE